jgi:hypothetical protein
MDYFHNDANLKSISQKIRHKKILYEQQKHLKRCI